MTGVTHKTAHLVDGARSFGESVVNAREHRVEGAVEAPHLGVGGGGVEPLGEVAGGKTGSSCFHLPQGGEGCGDQQAGERSAEDHDGEAKKQEDRGVPGDQRVCLFQAETDHDEHALTRGGECLGYRDHPPLASFGSAVDGEENLVWHQEGVRKGGRFWVLAGLRAVRADERTVRTHYTDVELGWNRSDAAVDAGGGVFNLQNGVIELLYRHRNFRVRLGGEVVAQNLHRADASNQKTDGQQQNADTGHLGPQ